MPAAIVGGGHANLTLGQGAWPCRNPKIEKHIERPSSPTSVRPTLVSLLSVRQRTRTLCAMQGVGDPQLHNSWLAMRAPSAKAASLTQTTLGCTSQVEAKLAKPQSAPAITLSRPTTPAKRLMRWAIASGCSTIFDEWVMTPGMRLLPSGSLTLSQTFHSCSWRGLAASNEYAPALILRIKSTMWRNSMSWTRGPILIL